MTVELPSKEKIEKLLTEKQLAVWQYLESTSEATPGEIAKKQKSLNQPSGNL